MDTQFNLTLLNIADPFPTAVSRGLIEKHPDMDFSRLVLVVSGGRVRRRILGLLADEAKARAAPMIPPEILTPGTLPDQLLVITDEARPLTSNPLSQQFAWADALRATPASERQRLFARTPDPDNIAAWLGMGEQLQSCHEELGSACANFTSVAAQAVKNGLLGDSERWKAAATVERLYIEELAGRGLEDPQNFRNRAILEGNIASRKQIVLAGVVQISAQLRAMLTRVADQVEVLLYSAANFRDRYDDLGCVIPAAWQGADLPVNRACIEVEGFPADQARAVFRTIAQNGRPVAADEVTIGVLDESLVPYLETEAANLGGLPIRYGPGRPITFSRPYTFATLAADFLESSNTREFSALVRHPDVLDWLKAQIPPASADSGEAAIDWLTLFDVYFALCLPGTLDATHSGPSAWPEGPDHRAMAYRPQLAWLYGAIDRLLGIERKERRPLAEWASPLLEILSRLYGGIWDTGDIAQRQVVESCRSMREGLDELRALTLRPSAKEIQVTAAEALRVLLAQVSSQRIAPADNGNEIDLVGWLELMADDAPQLIIVGFNEGIVPDAFRPKPFLNDSVRRVLGIVDEAARYARDAALLTAMLLSRNVGEVTLISGRVSAAGDALLPSRLLLVGDAATVAQRVLSFVETGRAKSPLAYKAGPGITSGFVPFKLPESEDIRALTSMSVTSFRDYIASPRGFYLKHVLGLQAVESEAPRELQAMPFGLLVHEVLKTALVPDLPSKLDSRAAWEDHLVQKLHECVRSNFGTQMPAALKLQVAFLEMRFQALAGWQHEWFRDGWQIRHREWKPAELPAINVDGKPMNLRGRIDRMDFNTNHNQWALLDYKVCKDSTKTPETTHRQGDCWVDLQLPLYRHLARSVLQGARPMLGYVRIADQISATGLARAEWDDTALTGADAVASDVVRHVRARNFEAIGDDPPLDGAFAYLFGEGFILADDETTEEGE